ncbi:hypothetical protein MDAP_002225 [Mitosporidium daphniae]
MENISENIHANIPENISENILLTSKCILPDNPIEVNGYDFNDGLNWNAFFSSFQTMGFQASLFYEACKTVDEMIQKKKENPSFKLFLGYTSNMVSCGNREIIRFLVEHKLVDVLVTTAGGIEEDIIKCLGPTLLGEFEASGENLRARGLNRIGNLLLPNSNYCAFEEFLNPILDECLDTQVRVVGEDADTDLNLDRTLWTPSRFIRKLGEKINNSSSIYYWAYRNDIPVFSPALTDGSIGDMMFFHSIKRGGLVLDIIQDIKLLNGIAIKAEMTGIIILGGGIPKHHIFNANLMRNGADYVVLINTGNEFEGSDAGASPDEAKSWGKIKAAARPIKVHGEASILFPLLVANTFAKTINL